MFAVWEPILAADWRKPDDRVMARLPDPRVSQFWDEQHLVARQLAGDARSPQPEAKCCRRDGVLWDLVAVYPPGVLWTDRIPTAVLFDGPVVRQQAKLAEAIRALGRQPSTAVESRQTTQ